MIVPSKVGNKLNQGSAAALPGTAQVMQSRSIIIMLFRPLIPTYRPPSTTYKATTKLCTSPENQLKTFAQQ